MSEVIIKYKRIKNIYIRVKPDLNIYVTAPRRVSKKYIYELLEKRKDWIEDKKEEIKKKNIYDTNRKELKSGNEIFYLGKSYILKVLKCKKENIIIACRIMYMYAAVKDDENRDAKTKQIVINKKIQLYYGIRN